ncbi:MAG TPA: VOC family protein [Burkholderiaceae bacterium]|jgi:catechol 2,3-dioxygenase-like lactoylglutathione lyase family enzyme
MLKLPSTYGAEIVHVAIQSDDAQATAAMYRDVLGYADLGTFSPKNLTAIWLFDGHTYLSVVTYHDESTAESRALPRTPCIHHLGLEADDPAQCAKTLLGMGYQLLSPEGEMPVKFMTPDKTMFEITPRGYFHARFIEQATPSRR